MGAILKNGVNYTGGGGSGTDDYLELINKPQINGTTLSGNKTSEALGLVTKAVDDLVNYYKKTETYTKGEIDTIVTAIKNSRFEAVATLPTSDIKTNVIYLVPKAESESGDIKDEYINLDGTTAGWERIGSTDIDLSGYVTTTALNIALANYTTTTDLMALLAGKQDKVQYSALPTASAELEGKIFEYTGATGNGLTHGYFYECVSDGQDPATYSWVQTNVQPSGGGGGGSYTAGDGIDIINDVISTKQSEEGDIDEIIDVYPQAGSLVSIVNAFNKGDIYSTDEKMIGQYIDGKPLYQKTFTGTSTAGASYYIDISSLNVDTPIDLKGYCKATNDNYIFGGNWRSQASDSLLYYVTSDKTKLYLDSGTNNVHGDYVLTLQYTKTTDTAISIGEETEYSTDEKIVGTWIDGKPIYQKTITGISPSNAGSVGDTTNAQSYSLGANIESLIKVQGQLHRISGGYHLSYEIGTQYLDNNQFFKMWFRLNDSPENANTVAICVGSDWVNSPFYLTIQYTKTS